MTELDGFIEKLQERVEDERKRIKACLGSPFFVRVNYERTLQLSGLNDALNLAMGYAASCYERNKQLK